jgi:RNA polymerase sigma factor (sigma-70 family)
MAENEWLADQFEKYRAHLRGVAYRMLGSVPEADDAVQDAWVRVSRAGAEDVDNLGGWLTTIVARVSLNMLRARKNRREEQLGIHVPDPILTRAGELPPEDQVVLADSVGLALLVVLETLTPAERLAFVLHDVFELRFEEIAPIVERTPAATRQLASRARRRVKGAEVPSPGADRARQWEVVDAFFAAARAGDFDGLVAVLDPAVVLRADFGPGHPQASQVLRGIPAVAQQARPVPGSELHHVSVNGAPGVVITVRGHPLAILAFTVSDGKIVEIDGIGDSDRVRRIAESVISFDE